MISNSWIPKSPSSEHKFDGGPSTDGSGWDIVTPNCIQDLDYMVSVLHWLAVSKASFKFITEQ